MRCEKVVIVNKLGMHARASAKFVSLASGFQSEISLTRNGQKVNGKSIMGIMMLAAARGTELAICADGNDEAEAISQLTGLINNAFGEDE